MNSQTIFSSGNGHVHKKGEIPIDFDLIKKVAELRPRWHWLIIGRWGTSDKTVQSDLPRADNLHYLGPRPRRESALGAPGRHRVGHRRAGVIRGRGRLAGTGGGRARKTLWRRPGDRSGRARPANALFAAAGVFIRDRAPRHQGLARTRVAAAGARWSRSDPCARQ